VSGTVRIGHAGLGVWGPNIARNLADLPGAELAYVCDADAGRLDRVASRFPNATLTTRF
jgi:predicted dehydrogenase